MVFGESKKPCKTFKADSGTVRFEMIHKNNMLNVTVRPIIALISKECPHEEIFLIKFNYTDSGSIYLKSLDDEKNIQMPDILVPLRDFEFWLTWYNGKISMGLVNGPPFLEYPKNLNTSLKNIGYINFEISPWLDWDVKCPPVPISPMRYKPIEGGILKWVKMTNNELPPDALIGGYENEPLYIARASHSGSLCPGKFLKSENCAYIPWGFEEHKKTDFEILCGYDAFWVKCKDNYVPENAFVAGQSEVNGENLYIGRAMIGSDLIVGKVHMLYKTCYLPYQSREVESYTYEILVRGDVQERGVTAINKCILNPMKALQPCI